MMYLVVTVVTMGNSMRKIVMTKEFYLKNCKVISIIVDNCDCSNFSACACCPLEDACLYYYTGDDSHFDEEEKVNENC